MPERPRVIRAVTVDLDDTLFPQSAWLSGAWRAVAAAAGRHGLSETDLLAALEDIALEGSDRGRIIDRALERVGGQGSFVGELVEAFTTHAPARLETYPGVLEALARLAEAEVPVAIVTDGNPVIQRAKVAALGLTSSGLVAALVISDEIGGRQTRKPHPAAFLEALSRLGRTPGETVHIGDRPEKDCAGAAVAGMRSIRVLTGEYATRAHPSGCPLPWLTVASFADAVDAILSE